MRGKRIIPCLDTKNGKVVKGTNFVGLRELGDPVELAKMYSDAGADELVLLDISATTEQRDTVIDLIQKVATQIKIPLTIGGGIRSVEDIRRVLDAGADKVGINSAAVQHPELVKEAAEKFGSNRIVIAIDAKQVGDTWNVVTHGGSKDTGIPVIDWSKKVEKFGAGEILLTSVDADGVKEGFDIPLTKAVAEAVQIPVIASGGVGRIEHFVEVFKETKAAAGLAASVFHEGTFTVKEVKDACKEQGVEIREA